MTTQAAQETPKKRLTWTREEFEEVSTEFLAKARETFDRDGYHAPMVFLFGTKDPYSGENTAHILPILAQFSSDKEKDMFAMAVQALAWKTASVGLIFISEMWHHYEEVPPGMSKNMTPAQIMEYMRGRKRPSECEDRMEALMLNVEHSRFGVVSHSALITRDAEEKPTLHEWKRFAGQQQGRFVHLLPQTD